ncbi:uncharacterized protein PV09_03590 [Verruconis gallopava]|uniref:AD domain-containing protein n=1 Tax=Verruconis gallopava TaxID=253628 RepID=A0A0D2AFI3_9PEZI|nr:uncharacterized protein PV09_03590 [Verruconis gallopava]KIW05733.1 hypothetical protein PV09_03590 [Verruconis gallopava]
MAETKRQSVASSKVAAKGPQLAADLSKAVGVRIRINTTLPSHTVEGIVFAVDAGFDVVVLRDGANFRVVPLGQINSFKVLGTAKEGDEEPITIGRVDTEALRQREAKAILEAKKAEANIGKGVTKEAQELYDYIMRTLPVRWSEKRIVVLDSVLVEPPYGVENVKAPGNKSQALAQIQRIVGGYWQKKKSGTSTPVNNGPPARAPVPAVPLGQRKGG